LVEGLTATLFWLVATAPLAPAQIILGLAIAALFIAIAVFDLHHSLIPDLWNSLVAACAAAYGYLVYGALDPLSLILGAIAAPLPLFLLWAYSRGRWMGFGDVKLAVSFGLLLGPLYGFVAVMAAFVIGAVVSLGVLLPLSSLMTCAQRYGFVSLSRDGARFTMQSEVPFGPFLITSCIILWLTLLYGIHIPLIP
jgi:prepilin signal peptidase PulO-like enzyme (type II secretory pathway)